MTNTLNVQELVFALAAKNHNPAILNPDFLKYSGIVPIDWELAQPPIHTNAVAQVTFQNGVSIIAQTNRIIFAEVIAAKDLSEVKVPTIARKYVETLPHVDYQAVGINPRGHVALEQEEDTARKYLAEMLLAPGSWREFGKAPVRATIQLAYELDKGQLNLIINEAALQLPEAELIPVILFSGNFNYEIAGTTQDERLGNLHQIIQNWQVNLETYKELVNTRFLGQESLRLDAALVSM